ncbi:MAG TPA: hypothetical protein VGR53_09900 [Nitrososphaerales archaeon]|nr:hypothetical protein [Nitrososphaerales archaeon]
MRTPLLAGPHGKRNLAAVLLFIAIIGGSSVYYLNQYSMQPSIQVTNISTASPVQNPSSQNVVSLGRVTNSGVISYTAASSGTYVLVFDNRYSDSPESVAVTYSIGGGPSNSMSFTVLSGESRDVSTTLLAGQSITGSFSVAGTSGNSIAFQIMADTCTQSISFSFSLVNTGNANGFATVGFQADGQTVWSNKYFVQTGQQLPASASTSFSNCASHNYALVILSQEKS